MNPVTIEFLMRDNLTPGMDKAGQSAEALGKKAEDTSDAIKKKIEEQRTLIKEIESELKSLEKTYGKMAPGKEKMEFGAELGAARKVLNEEKNILLDLSEKYKSAKEAQTTYFTQMRKIREEMASLTSADGTVSQENIQRYNELKTKLSDIGTAYRRVRQEQKLVTEGSASLAGLISGISGVVGAFSAAQGVSSLFIKDNEDLSRVQTRLQSVMAITIGLQQTATELSATGAFYTQIWTKATNLFTIANTRLATALGISTGAAKALMATLTLGLSVVITGLIIAWNKYSDAQEKAAAKTAERLEVEKNGRAEMIKTRVEIDNTKRSIKDFNGTKEEEKVKVDELNRKYGEAFGYYKTIGEWYDVLQQKGEDYIQMLFLQAKAQSLVNKAIIADEEVNKIKAANPDEVEGSMGWFEKTALYMAQNNSYSQINAQEEIEKYNQKAKDEAVKAAEEVRDAYLDEARKLEEEVAAIRKKSGIGNFAVPENDKDKTKMSDLAELELKARKKIEDNVVSLEKEGYERQRKEAELAFNREKERIADEEKQRLELYEKLRKVGHPVTKAQKETISAQADEQEKQAKDIYEQTLAGINAKEKLELEKQEKVIKDALAKYQTYYQKRLSVLTQYQKDRENLEKGGATEGQYAELDYQQEKALSAIDKEFAMREDSFQVWADSIVNLSLEQLRKLLDQAQQELQRMELLNPTGDLSSYRQKIIELEKMIAGFNKKNNNTPEQSSFKQWAQLSKTLNRAKQDFREIGDAIGGTAGDILSSAGEIATSTLSMISSISELANWSVTSTKMTAEGASKAIQAVEKASVILAIISAAIQLLSKLQELIPDAHEEYLNYAAKVNEINILRDAVQEYELAVLKAKQAEESWFASGDLSYLRKAKELNKQILDTYIDKVGEPQAIYQNEDGGGWLTAIWKPINWVIDNTYGKLYGFNILREYEEGITAAINNLRIETKKKSSGFLGTGIGGNSQKTEDLVSYVKRELGYDLFDDNGMIDLKAAEVILDKYGDKLVGQTKETLEALVELREQYDEYLEQLHEYVSSLYEPLVDNFVDSLWDWFDEGKDALDSFKDYASQTFRDIVSDMMRTVLLEKIFGTGENSFQEQLNALYEDYASGKIKTEAELAAQVSGLTSALIGRYESALPGLKNIMESITDSLEKAGIDLRETEAYSQSGRAGAITTITQDTGNKLEGIGTSMQMHLANIDEGVENIGSALGNALASLIKIEEYTGQSSKTLAEIKIYVERILSEGLFIK
jgi:hypothetical protein